MCSGDIRSEQNRDEEFDSQTKSSLFFFSNIYKLFQWVFFKHKEIRNHKIESSTQFLNKVLPLVSDYCRGESNFSFYPKKIHLVNNDAESLY